MLVSGPDSGVVPGLSSVRGLEGVSRADRATNLHALWRALIPGSVSTRVLSASEIVIVPDGPLHQLPFEALVIRPGSRADEVQYWLDEGPVVRYAPSATVLYNLTRRGGSPIMGPRGPAVLSVSDPLYDVSQVRQAGSSESAMFSLAMLAPRLRDSYERTGGALARLPGTARETAAIRAAYGTEAARSVQVLQGPQADEPRTRQALTGKRYLHLATHGLVAGHRDALFASLALTPPVGEVVDSTSDGFLQLHEIYDLRLGEVELAVLSACDTNRGPALDGEGVFALSRGFLAAGARRVVASQWSVGDDSTAELMGALFTRIVERERAGRVVDYAASLRDAKRVVRSRPQWRDPFHWAPFVLTGRR
jgi:CHAT domain-containing protein